MTSLGSKPYFIPTNNTQVGRLELKSQELRIVERNRIDMTSHTKVRAAQKVMRMLAQYEHKAFKVVTQHSGL